MEKCRVFYNYLFLLQNPVQTEVNGIMRIVTDCSIHVEFSIKNPRTGSEIFFADTDNVYMEDEISLPVENNDIKPYQLLNVSIDEDGLKIEKNPQYEQPFHWQIVDYIFGVYTGEQNLINPDGSIKMPVIVDEESVDRTQFEKFVEDNLKNLINNVDKAQAKTTCYGTTKVEEQEG